MRSVASRSLRRASGTLLRSMCMRMSCSSFKKSCRANFIASRTVNSDFFKILHRLLFRSLQYSIMGVLFVKKFGESLLIAHSNGNKKGISLYTELKNKKRTAHLARAVLFGFNSYASCTAGYTLTFFLSRPKRSKRTTPSTLAKRVSSPPRPTFSPG